MADARTCASCGWPWHPSRSGQRYCSPQCEAAAVRAAEARQQESKLDTIRTRYQPEAL